MGTATKFLTNAPEIQKIRDGEYSELSILTYALSANPYGRITVVRNNLTTVDYDTATLAVIKNRLTLPIVFPSAETFSNVLKLECSIRIGTTRQSEYKYFYPDQTTRKYSVRIGWLNLLGGIDRYTFTGIQHKQINVDSDTFIKELAFPILKEDRGESVLRTVSSSEQTIFSDFEPETSIYWLTEILTSPEVWIEEGGYHISIILLSKMMMYQDPRLIQIQLKYKMSNERISQNG